MAILLCTHNGARFLGEQLDSLIAQDFAACRVFIHDWGSTDDTPAIIESRRKRWPRDCALEIVRHDVAPGACLSFLNALQHVVQLHRDFDYLLFCDQDDVWHPGKLAAFARRARTNPDLDLIYCDVGLIDAEGRRLAAAYLRPGGVFGRPLDIDHASVLFVNSLSGMSMGVSRRLLLRGMSAWGFEGWVMHDWAIVIVAHLLAAKAAFIPESLVDYRQHGANLVGSAQPVRPGSALAGLRRARAYVHAVKQQYLISIELQARWRGPRRLNAQIGRLGVARTVLSGRSVGLVRALKVAAGYWAFWP